MPNDAHPEVAVETQTLALIPQQASQASLSQKSAITVLSSVTTGIVTTALFNPIDRALYLAVVEKRPFLSKANFIAPYQGCFQAMVQKCIFGSLYYIPQGILNKNLHPYLISNLKTKEVTANLSVGLTAGSINGVLNNPMSAVKYRTWGDDTCKYLPTALEMWKVGGCKAFIRGTRPTVYREMAFGAVYEELRHELRAQFITQNTKSSKHSSPQNNTQNKPGSLLTVGFACDLISGIFATVAAAPFNYARNMQYKTSLQEKVPTVTSVLSSTCQEAKKHSKTLLGKAGFFATKLQIGWGTGRAGLGMALGQILYNEAEKAYTQHFKPRG